MAVVSPTCALQVGGNSDGDDEGNRVCLQLFADLNGNRSNHQNSGHIINKSGDNARDQAQRHRCPLNIGHPVHNDIRQTGGHAAVDEKLHQAHSTADHQQNIKVQGADDLVHRQHAQNNKEQTGGQRNIGAVLAEGQHQHIRRRKQNNCR